MITIHEATAADFSGLGLGALTPASAEIEERAGGMFELRMTHPMDADGKWWNIAEYRVLRVNCPVRQTPLVEISGSAAREVWAVKSGTRLRLRTAPSTAKGKVLGRYPAGTRVVKTGEDGKWFQVIVAEGGAGGWMHGDYLQYVETLPGTAGGAIQPRQTREQLFRIVQVERDDAAGMVHVIAQHIFYDLAGNIVRGAYAPENAAAADVCGSLLEKAILPHDFHMFCTAEGKVSGDYGGMSIVSALLEKEIGVAAQTGAQIIRDNFDVFVLQDEVRDQGVEIRHGKNLQGAVMTVDAGGVVTRIVPVGRDIDGEKLYLDGDIWVDSPRAAEIPVMRAKEIEYDVSVVKKSQADAEEGTYPDNASARAKLLELAQADFAAGIDAPLVGLDVDFVALEHTAEYAQYAGLQAIHLYDTVRVVSPRSGIDARLQVTGYVWDALAMGGKGRYTALTLGSIRDLETVSYGYDIAEGTLSGTKVINGSVGGEKIRNASIRYANIGTAAVERLSADALTAVTAHMGSLTAETVQTDQLYAALANVIALAADKISAGEISADRLAAALADVVTLTAKAGEFDLATVQNLLSQALILQQGTAGSMMIANLAVTSANMLNATIGELVLKGADGGYWHVFVGADGAIRTEAATVSDGEIEAGQTSAGNQIVETDANIGELNAQNIQAQSAVIAEIFTGALTAGKITAAEAMLASATIPALYADTIRAIGETIDISANDSIILSAGGTGLSRLLRLDGEGVHVGLYGNGSELLLDEKSLNVMMNGQRYSRFAADHAQFGNYQLRRSADGGLVFKLKEG